MLSMIKVNTSDNIFTAQDGEDFNCIKIHGQLNYHPLSTTNIVIYTAISFISALLLT